MKKRRLILIATKSLFGTGIISLLEMQRNLAEIKKVENVRTALEISGTFKPDVIIYFREKVMPEEEHLLQKLVAQYHTRVVHCTLEANHLTIYDKTRIQNATVEDLMSAVMK